MAFEGTLDAFGLRVVLRWLGATAKTGCLTVEGDRGSGVVWVDGGELVEASADGVPPTAPPDEVIFELLRSGSGSFSFAIDDPPRGAGRGSQDVDDVLGQADQLLEEWRDLEAVVPSSRHRAALIHELDCGEVTVDARLWPALVAVASGGKVADIGHSFGLGELGVARMVRDLVELGVAIVEPPGPHRRQPITDLRHTTGEPVARTPSASGKRWVRSASLVKP